MRAVATVQRYYKPWWSSPLYPLVIDQYLEAARCKRLTWKPLRTPGRGHCLIPTARMPLQPQTSPSPVICYDVISLHRSLSMFQTSKV
jgi:hypothetical protein